MKARHSSLCYIQTDDTDGQGLKPFIQRTKGINSGCRFSSENDEQQIVSKNQILSFERKIDVRIIICSLNLLS